MASNLIWKIITAVACALLAISISLSYFSNRGMRKINDYIVVEITTTDGNKYALASDCRLTYYNSKLAVVRLDSPRLISSEVN